MTNLSRRSFLSSGLGALGGVTLMASPGASLSLLGGPRGEDERTLVLIEFKGGNDGLSTLVPYGDDAYYNLRKRTRVEPKKLHRIDEYRGLQPELQALARRYEQGSVAVVQGVGYPNANLSHFKSLEIWHTADLRGRAGNDGWIGRLCANTWPDRSLPERTIHIGPEAPYSLASATHPPVAFHSPDTYRWLGDEDAEASLGDDGQPTGNPVLDRVRGVMRDARGSSERILRVVRKYETKVDYPGTDSGRALRSAAALIDARLGSRVISIRIGGFDTHANQSFDHPDVMRKVDASLDAFLTDVQRSEAGKRTLVVAYSEFGRRVRENGSGGTDHGKAGVLFAVGADVRGGLYGEYPSLTDLDDHDLRFNVDFRRVYASAIRYMGGDDEAVLGARFEALPYV